MSEVKLPALPVGAVVNSDGSAKRSMSSWMRAVHGRLGGSTDKVNQALTTADAAAPGDAELVAGAGLQNGGAIGSNASVALYKAVTSVAGLSALNNQGGDWAYAVDGRNSGEGVGAGTGCPVVWNNPLARWVIPGQTAAITA